MVVKLGAFYLFLFIALIHTFFDKFSSVWFATPNGHQKPKPSTAQLPVAVSGSCSYTKWLLADFSIDPETSRRIILKNLRIILF